MTVEAPLHDVFPALHCAGFGVVDVGSRGGLHPIFDDVASLVDAVGFEPDIEECDRLNRRFNAGSPYRSLTFLPFGLGDKEGCQTLNLCRLGGVSSVYSPNRPLLDRFPDAGRFDVVGTLQMPVRRFDDLQKDSQPQLPSGVDFIKVDTQGSELNILRGAENTLRRYVVAVEVEVEFSRLYESQPLFRDIDLFLSDCGFTLFKLRRAEWVRQTCERRPLGSAGQLMFGDALYLRDPLDPRAGWFPKDSRQAEALIVSALLYDLHDFAIEISLNEPIARMVKANKIQHYISQRSARLHRPFGHLLAARDLMRWCKNALGSFRRYRSHWSRGDDNFYSRY